MNRRQTISVVSGAVAGAIAALALGLLAVELAPENGFADLAAAAVTRVFLVPAGAAIGAVLGYLRAR